MRPRRVARLAAALMAVVALGGFFGRTAAAQEAAGDEVAELDAARALIDQAVRLYADGRVDEAYSAARNGYLDHFELVEIDLRARDDPLTLELEEDFARLRGAMQDGAPTGEVRSIAAELGDGLDRAERALTSPGLAAPLLAVLSAFSILFREGLEAVLILAAVLGYLEASRNGHYRGAVLRGVAGAFVATLLTFVVVTAFVRLAPIQRELIEAITAVAAVVVLFYLSFWLVSRLDQRRWMEFMRAKVWTAAATGSTFALFAVGFTAVFREGLETVLFYQALLVFASGLELYVALGTAIAAALLTVVGWSVLVAGRRVPMKQYLQLAVVLIMALSVAFVGNAVRALQEIGIVGISFLESAPRLPIFLAELTGWHPTVEGLMAQVGLALVYVAGGLWLAVVVPRRARRVAPAQMGPSPDAGTE